MRKGKWPMGRGWHRRGRVLVRVSTVNVLPMLWDRVHRKVCAKALSAHGDGDAGYEHHQHHRKPESPAQPCLEWQRWRRLRGCSKQPRPIPGFPRTTSQVIRSAPLVAAMTAANPASSSADSTGTRRILAGSLPGKRPPSVSSPQGAPAIRASWKTMTIAVSRMNAIAARSVTTESSTRAVISAPQLHSTRSASADGVSARTVDIRHLGSHRAKVGRKLPPMMDAVVVREADPGRPRHLHSSEKVDRFSELLAG